MCMTRHTDVRQASENGRLRALLFKDSAETSSTIPAPRCARARDERPVARHPGRGTG
jgi:hypothetical protein